MCETRDLYGINAIEMSAQQRVDAGARRDLVYIFQCPFERARDAAVRSLAGGYRIQPTITGTWPEDYCGAGPELHKARVRLLHEWFTP
ncbi:hypothetical protein ACH6CV_12605 [Bacillota bacterium Meth-B3]